MLRSALSVCALATLAACATPAADPAAAKAAVSDFVARAEACDHWAGEPPWDAARAADIAKALDELDCENLDRDRARLSRRHPEARAALRDALQPAE